VGVCACAGTPTRLTNAHESANAPVALLEYCMKVHIVFGGCLLDWDAKYKIVAGRCAQCFGWATTHETTLDFWASTQPEELIGNSDRNIPRLAVAPTHLQWPVLAGRRSKVSRKFCGNVACRCCSNGGERNARWPLAQTDRHRHRFGELSNRDREGQIKLKRPSEIRRRRIPAVRAGLESALNWLGNRSRSVIL